MEALITQYSRLRIWATILISLFLIVVLIGAVRSATGPEPIGVTEALEQGGHVVVVTTNCPPELAATHKVITQAGRPPARSSGELSGNKAEVIVSPDWIGNIKVETGRRFHRIYAVSETIGGPFGWDARQVHLDGC